MRNVLRSIVLLVVIGGAILAYLGMPFLTSPTFNVTNFAGASVELTVEWRDKMRDLGGIGPGRKIEFEIDDEAAATFVVAYADGSKLRSEPIYFTSGVVVYAEIHESNIEVSYESGT